MPAPLLLIFRSLRFGSDRIVLSLIFIYHDDPLAFRLQTFRSQGTTPALAMSKVKCPACVGGGASAGGSSFYPQAGQGPLGRLPTGNFCREKIGLPLCTGWNDDLEGQPPRNGSLSQQGAAESRGVDGQCLDFVTVCLLFLLNESGRIRRFVAIGRQYVDRGDNIAIRIDRHIP